MQQVDHRWMETSSHVTGHKGEKGSTSEPGQQCNRWTIGGQKLHYM